MILLKLKCILRQVVENIKGELDDFQVIIEKQECKPDGDLIRFLSETLESVKQ